MPDPSSGDLESSLGYLFSESSLCDRALRHSSVGGSDFERFEFLGDAALSLAVAWHLCREHPDWDEGMLTKMRAAFVNNDNLVEVAERLGLRRYLRLSAELSATPSQAGPHPVFARALEALIGAVFLDGGLDGVLQIVEKLFDERQLETAGHPKSLLQEWLQARNLELPEYRETGREGKVHAPFFEVECVLESPEGRFLGTGYSLKQAETQAARRALDFITSATDL